jgi:maltose O-acetyltransferase
LKHVVAFFNFLCIGVGNTLPMYSAFNRLRPAFYRWSGMHVASGVVISGRISVRPDSTYKVVIDEGTYVNSEVRFGCQGDEIRIGRYCLVGPRVSFETAGHHLEWHPMEGRGLVSRPIVVGDRAWIGAGATILQGVSIGEQAVVAAGAVVHRDVPPRTVVGGVPARVLRRLGD